VLTELGACNVGVDGSISWQSVSLSVCCRLRVCRLWSDFHARHAAKPLLVCGVRLSATSADDRAGERASSDAANSVGLVMLSVSFFLEPDTTPKLDGVPQC
jgi:hypothetical protein